ncbi:MAG: c-type cytochrome domain-containing protein [Pseudomonadota bacterium]
MNLIYFIGRFHVLALHLPIGILAMAIGVEVYGRLRKTDRFDKATDVLWIAGACSALLTVVLGLMHAAELGADQPGVIAHRNAGVALLLISVVAAAMRVSWWRAYQRLWPAGVATTAGLLIVTGHLGGNLTHGETYLVEYGPAPLRRLAGLSDPPVKVSKLEDGDLFANVVNPSLQQRCSTCHNNSKRSGEFSVISYESIMKGGENGAVIVSGDPEQSDLFRRVSLAHDDDEFMPKDGKTPLSDDQVKAIRWWIQAGAPKKASLALLQPPADVRPAILRSLGLASEDAKAPSGAEMALTEGTREADESLPALNVDTAAPELIVDAEQRGFVVRPIAMANPLLDVSITPNHRIANDDLAVLERLSTQVVQLDLTGAGLKDSDLAAVAKFTNVERLRLSKNDITDAGLGKLTGLERLESISLTETKVTPRGIVRLADLPNVRTIYIWRPDVAVANQSIERGARRVQVIAQMPRAAPGKIARTTDEQLAALDKLLSGEIN